MEGYSLKKFLRSPINVRYLPYTLLGLSILGFFDGLYLTIIHYKNLIPPCTIGGCEVVLTSKYAMVGPFPTSLYGVAFYLAVIILTGILITLNPVMSKPSKEKEKSSEIVRLDDKFVKIIIPLLFFLCLLGLLVGLFLIYLQAFVLHAYCQYCLASEVIDFLMFDAAWWLYNSLESPQKESSKEVLDI